MANLYKSIAADKGMVVFLNSICATKLWCVGAIKTSSHGIDIIDKAIVFLWNGGMDQIRRDTLEQPHCKGGIDLHVVEIKLKLAASFIGYVHFRGLEMPESYSARLELYRYVRYLVLWGVSSVHINSGGITHKMSVPLLGAWR